MYRLLISLIITSTFFVSCKDNDDSTPLEVENFYALTIGNTYNYEYFRRVGLTDQFESLNVFDEVEITGTTEINGEEFYIFQTTTTGNSGAPTYVPENGIAIAHYRVSQGYLLNDAGIKLFASTNPEEEYFVVQQTFFSLYGQLVSGTNNVEVPAGVFSALNNKIYAIHENGSILPGESNKYYANEIGLLMETYSAISNPIYYGDKRLVNYSLN